MLTKVVGGGHMRCDDNAFIVPEAAVAPASPIETAVHPRRARSA
jgi:hypothetical protein